MLCIALCQECLRTWPNALHHGNSSMLACLCALTSCPYYINHKIFVVKFEHISYFLLVFLLMIVKQIMVYWDGNFSWSSVISGSKQVEKFNLLKISD